MRNPSGKPNRKPFQSTRAPAENAHQMAVSSPSPARGSSRWVFGFHAIASRLRAAPGSVIEVYADPARRDARMRDLESLAHAQGAKLVHADAKRLDGMAGGERHQGVVAKVEAKALSHSLDDVLDALAEAPLVLVLDGVTDPHNLGAALRVADGAGAHAVVAPKDRSVGLSATAIKVASGAADYVPFITVTNLARTLRELQEREVWVVGTSDQADKDIYADGLAGPYRERSGGALALVMGAEGEGMRRLTGETCDELRSIPMRGSVSSLNVSVACGVALYEARRQREADLGNTRENTYSKGVSKA
jgi:23S rRNA (guanosine2251-2'-O)-methyltransferase